MPFALPQDHLTWAFLGGYLLSAALAFGIADALRPAWPRHPSTRSLVLLAGCVGLWAGLNALRVLATTVASKAVIHVVMYAFIFSTPVLFLVFAISYSGFAGWLTPRRLGLLALVPALGWLALLTNALHHGFYTTAWIDPSTGTPILATAVAPPFWVFAAYNWGLFLVGGALLVHVALASHPRYRPAAFAILVGVSIPLFANVAYLAGVKPHPHLDPTPVFLAVGAVPIAYGVRRSQLRDPVPFPRHRVLARLDAAYLVVDGDSRLADFDEDAQDVLGLGDADIGRPVTAVLPDELLEAVAVGRDGVHWEARSDGDRRTFLVRTAPLVTTSEASAGRVLTLTEITDQEERRRLLEAKADRLDAFAGVLSHDLRNPLTVAHGRLELAREDVDSEHLSAAADALDRIDRLVEATLAYAKAGTAGEPEPVDLARLAELSWEHVPTDGAVLRVDDSPALVADAVAVEQLLENLFRNAVQHGGGDVTVRVGRLDGGFFVADDGPGIAPDRRDAVFERGYSEDETGTGFGLSIVREIAATHGWSVRVEESAHGGARFEITGVETRY